MQTAWGILLGRLSGRDDVVFGVTVAGRPAELAGVEHMVGLFINTLPLRLQLRPELPLAALLRQTQDSQSRLMAHQHLGLAEIQQAAGVGDLFDTLLVFENYPVDRAGLAAESNGLRLGRVEGRDATHYPLALIVQPGETLQLRLDYRPDLFDAATVEVMGRRLIRLLEAAVADAAQPLGHLPILDTAERDTILRSWNNTTQPVLPMTLPALFAAQAACTPDAVAVVFEDRTLSYAALDAHANRLAHRLRDWGVGPDVLVGVCAERSLELVVGLLAVLKAGGAYVPLDPEYPAGRLSDMVSDAELRVVLLQGAALGALPPQDGVTRILLELNDLSALASVSAPSLDDLHSDHLAYMIYTSGSTGKPKGAANTHAGLHNRLAWMQDAYGLTGDDVVLQKTPFSFDVSVWEFFWPLIVGARLVVAGPGAHRDSARLVETIRREGVTTLHFVPSMLQAFAEYIQAEGTEPEHWSSLRRVICSGEALPAELRDRVAKYLPQVQLENLYGPTEASIDVTRWACGGGPNTQVARSGTRRCMCWTAALSRCRPVWSASCTSRAWVWRGAT
jgi:amino acid adenylation domain-containing protein